jgi:hypothetical protein
MQSTKQNAGGIVGFVVDLNGAIRENPVAAGLIGYNGYVLERNCRRIIFTGDTALSDSFEGLRAFGPIDLEIRDFCARIARGPRLEERLLNRTFTLGPSTGDLVLLPDAG